MYTKLYDYQENTVDENVDYSNIEIIDDETSEEGTLENIQ